MGRCKPLLRISPTTPMTWKGWSTLGAKSRVCGTCDIPVGTISLPTGSESGKYRWAKVLLITATCAPRRTSSLVRSRPCKSGVRRTEKQPGLVGWNSHARDGGVRYSRRGFDLFDERIVVVHSLLPTQKGFLRHVNSEREYVMTVESEV